MDSQDKTPHKDKPASAHLSRSAQRALDAAQHMAAIQQKRLLGLLALGLLLNAVIAFFLYEYLVIERQTETLHQLTQVQVDRRVELIGKYLLQQNQRLDQLASLPEVLADLSPETLADSSERAMEQHRSLETRLMRDTPQALKARLIPTGSATLEQEGDFPLRFSELDLIRRAEERKPAPPELIARNEGWVINWIRPVATDAQADVRGSLLLTMEATELLNNLNYADTSLGEASLLQQFPSSPVQVIKTSGSGSAGPSIQAAIPGSYLQLKFTPSPALVADAEELPTLWVLCVSLIAAASLALIWFGNKWWARSSSRAATATPTLERQLSLSKDGLSKEEILANPLFQKQDILDITMIDEDQDILGLHEATGKQSKATTVAKISESEVPLEIFRSYDIRGLVPSQINADFAFRLGQAIGSEAIDQGEHSLIVGRDGRTHSEQLTEALIKGILRSGCHVINIGTVPTPLMYFASFHFDDCNSGVVVTASHNPKEYNGFKVVINNRALADAAVLDLRARIISQRLHQGAGVETSRAIIPDYIDRIFSDVALAGNVSLVIDAGNAVPGLVAPALFDELGCEVTELFCELDGEFPNHNPDPTDEKNLQALIAKVQEVNADLGVAFDGDGDRLVVVTPKGDIIWPDRLLMLFAKDILARNPGADVLFDVKCSRQLNQVISSYGGRPIMWKTGHSPMKAKMEETEALIGGEYSGHIFIKDRWYGFDDGIYAMARLLEIITLRDQKIDDIFAAFPQLISTPEIKITIGESDKFGFMQKLIETSDFNNGNLTTIDGLRVDYTKGWGLVRASNTSPALTLRFEAESQEAMEKIQQIFKRELLKIDSSLTFTF